MKVTLRALITGTRNGKEWPAPGEDIDLPEQEATDLITLGLATPVTTHRDAEKAVPNNTAETRQALVPKRTMKGGAR